jgi:hypothetical protein
MFHQSLFGHFVSAARRYVTHWALAGAILAFTGLPPDHWVAMVFEYMKIADAARQIRYADYRLLAIFLGAAIIVGNVLVRRRKSDPVHGGRKENTLVEAAADREWSFNFRLLITDPGDELTLTMFIGPNVRQVEVVTRRQSQAMQRSGPAVT